MGLELATEALVGTTSSLKEIHEHPLLPFGIFAEHRLVEFVHLSEKAGLVGAKAPGLIRTP